MKNLALILTIATLGACTWANEEDLITDDPGPMVDCNTVTLSGTVAPIIQSNCALPACHGGNRSPLMTSDQEIINAANRIKARTGAGTMPPSGPLPAEEIEAIACWVDAGAPNN